MPFAFVAVKTGECTSFSDLILGEEDDIDMFVIGKSLLQLMMLFEILTNALYMTALVFWVYEIVILFSS